MKRFIILAAFLSSIANAQDVPPPPKPRDEGPSLVDTMKFIEEKLGSIGRVNYVSYAHDNITGNDYANKFSAEASNVRTSVTECRIYYHWKETREQAVLDDIGGWVPVKDVHEVVVETREQAIKKADTKAGHPEYTNRVDPPVFVIVANWKDGENYFYLYDESLANRLAKALVHAVELCGGGSKDPF